MQILNEIKRQAKTQMYNEIKDQIDKVEFNFSDFIDIDDKDGVKICVANIKITMQGMPYDIFGFKGLLTYEASKINDKTNVKMRGDIWDIIE